MTTKTITTDHVARLVRLAASVALGIMAAMCIYAVIALRRPDHIATAAGYILLLWGANRKDRDNEENV